MSTLAVLSLGSIGTAGTSAIVAMLLIAFVKGHLVILDFMMPVMSGPATLEALRKDAGTAKMLVIMVSAVEEESVREYTDQYDLFLRKPFGVGELMKAVHSLIGD